MSMDALRWVRPIKVTSTQKLVLWVLADQAKDDSARAWPSIAAMMEATCLSERSVRGALRELEALDLIRTERGGGRYATSCYRLMIGGKGATGADTRQDVPPSDDEEKGQLVPERGQLLPETGQVVPEKGQVVPPNPQEPNRTQREPKATRVRAAAVRVEVDLPHWLPADAWADWVEDRRQRRKPLTQKAAELSIRDLGKLRDKGQDPRAVIENAIAKSWQGLYGLPEPRAEKPEFRNGFLGLAHREARGETPVIDADDDPVGYLFALEAPRAH